MSAFQSLEESDVSFIWPIRSGMSLIGRWNFGWDENQTIESFFGVEFNDCCWKSRIVWRRFLKEPRNSRYRSRCHEPEWLHGGKPIKESTRRGNLHRVATQRAGDLWWPIGFTTRSGYGGLPRERETRLANRPPVWRAGVDGDRGSAETERQDGTKVARGRVTNQNRTTTRGRRSRTVKYAAGPSSNCWTKSSRLSMRT